MANALEEISREHLECVICCELYTDPRLLPCLHSFCTECLNLYLQHKNTIIECPTCRRTYNVPDSDLTQFPINFPLRNLVEDICEKQRQLSIGGTSDDQRKATERCTDSYHNKKPKSCDSCGQVCTLVAQCQDCDQRLCQFCKEAHLRVLAFRGHKVTEMTLHEQKRSEPPMQQKCCKHPDQEAKYFCLMCGVMVCSDCAVTVHRTSEHNVVSLKEAAKNRREFLQRKVDNVLVVVDEMDKKKSEVTPPTESSGKGTDTIETTQRARNACQIVTQALEQSGDDDVDFLVLFGTLDAMLQQICDEFVDAGFLQTEGCQPDAAELEGCQPGDDAASSHQLPPLVSALQALSIHAAEHYRHIRPFLRPHGRRHHPPPPATSPQDSSAGSPPAAGPQGPSSVGIDVTLRPGLPGWHHGPPQFGLFGHHRHHHRGHRGRGHRGHHGRGRGGRHGGRCHRK